MPSDKFNVNTYTKYKMMGRVLCISDDLVYCLFPAWGRYMAIGIPIHIFGHKPEPNLRFHVQGRLDLIQPHFEDFEFSDWKFDFYTQ